MHQMRGLGGDVQAGGDAQALERLLLREPGADVAQHRHRPLGPLDAAMALLGQLQVLDVMRDLHLLFGRPFDLQTSGGALDAGGLLERFGASVRSQVNSFSVRPKCPYAAVFS